MTSTAWVEQNTVKVVLYAGTLCLLCKFYVERVTWLSASGIDHLIKCHNYTCNFQKIAQLFLLLRLPDVALNIEQYIV